MLESSSAPILVETYNSTTTLIELSSLTIFDSPDPWEYLPSVSASLELTDDSERPPVTHALREIYKSSPWYVLTTTLFNLQVPKSSKQALLHEGWRLAMKDKFNVL